MRVRCIQSMRDFVEMLPAGFFLEFLLLQSKPSSRYDCMTLHRANAKLDLHHSHNTAKGA
jgi:hypothetical protein